MTVAAPDASPFEVGQLCMEMRRLFTDEDDVRIEYVSGRRAQVPQSHGVDVRSRLLRLLDDPVWVEQFLQVATQSLNARLVRQEDRRHERRRGE